MASCNPFDVAFKSEPAVLFEKVKVMLAQYNGTVTGNEQQASFQLTIPVIGQIKGKYVVNGKVATITITDRPWLLACTTVEKFLRDKIAEMENLDLHDLLV
ncbi:hypothetical protein [Spartinivicinus poritis]|uniref:Uncharacterized protein n=1 Tax=Spartinivicinus poritis TaxID=2994640 RepID=A0ABT5U5A8_9GAMM|nr:hypothetical protein [Spartinivicinus sp. A2-2]MDE1461400.1 hypothetical protein [Spartinivicinus sp. A2-2]